MVDTACINKHKRDIKHTKKGKYREKHMVSSLCFSLKKKIHTKLSSEIKTYM